MRRPWIVPPMQAFPVALHPIDTPLHEPYRISMNRTGLLIASIVGIGVGLVFAVWPQLDIAIAKSFFDQAHGIFPAQYSVVAPRLRDGFNYTTAALVAPACIALLLKLVRPRRRMLVTARAAIFLTSTLALAPGLMANVILK